MPLNVNVPGVGLVAVPDELKTLDEQAAFIRKAAAAKGTFLEPPDVTLGEKFVGAGAGLTSGIGALTAFPGQLYGLATGDMDNLSTRAGAALQKQGREWMPESIRLQEEARSRAVREAEKEGVLPAAWTALSETVSRPGLLSSFAAEQIPQLVGPGAGAKLAAVGAEGAAKLAAKEFTKEAAEKAGVTGAVGVGATMQGADIGADTYNAVKTDKNLPNTEEFKSLIAAGFSPDAAREKLAIDAARLAAGAAGAISVGTQFLPGGRAVEEALAGRFKPGMLKGAIKGAAGETVQEALEEGGGQFVSNVAQPGVTDLTRGVGEAAGLGALGGLGLGGGAGAISGMIGARDEQARIDQEQAEAALNKAQDIQSPFVPAAPPEAIVPEAATFASLAPEFQNNPFTVQDVINRTGDAIQDEGSALSLLNELSRRGDIIQDGIESYDVIQDGKRINSFATPEEASTAASEAGGDVFERPTFRFLTEAEKIAPTLPSNVPYVFATPKQQEVGQTAEGYEVSAPGLELVRKAKTEEEANNIVEQINKRIESESKKIDEEVAKQNSAVEEIRNVLNQAISDPKVTDDNLALLHDDAAEKIAVSNAEVQRLEDARAKLQTPVEVTPINPQASTAQGYEVRMYRPGQQTVVMEPFLNREEAEDFILKNAPVEQLRAIKEDQEPARATIRQRLDDLIAGKPAEVAAEVAAEAPAEAEQTEAIEPTPEMQEKLQAVSSRMRSVLDQMGLKNIGLNVQQRLTQSVGGKLSPVDGYYLNRVISASLEGTRDVTASVGHETIHALRELGMFSDKEWGILTDKAQKEWVDKYRIRDRYKNVQLTDEKVIEEAIADAFGDWMSGRLEATGVIKGLFNRIKEALGRIGSVLRGQGFTTSDQVFQRALKGKLEGERKEVVAKPEEPQLALPMMYSALDKAVLSAPKDFDKKTGKEWAGWLKNNGGKYGVKPDEMFWTGLDDYLEVAKDSVVTRQALSDFVQKSGPQLGEVVKGGRPKLNMTREQIVEARGQVFAQYDQDIRNLEEEKRRATSYDEIQRLDDDIRNLQDEAFRIADESYPLPTEDEYAIYQQAEVPEEAVVAGGGEGGPRWSKLQLPGGKNYVELLLTLPVKEGEQAFYKRSHYAEPNIVLHLRMNERKDVAGNNVLFVEELQSDWGQAFRKSGEEAVPSGPFIGKTSAWVDLGLKRAMTYAIENGFDKVAFINGQQNADRYDLSKQINSIIYSKNADGTYRLGYKPIEATENDAYQDTINNRDLSSMTIEDVEQTFGKEVADKIQQNVGEESPFSPGIRKLGNVDLVAGGEGMKAFYDNIVPTRLKELTRKVGGNVSTTKIDIEGNISEQVSLDVTPELANKVVTEGVPQFALPMDVVVDGTVRTTNNEKGAKIHPTETGIRNFWRWFGNSQTVTGTGAPRVFYHASNKDIEKFRRGQANAIFFTPATTFANNWTLWRGDDPVIYPAYLRINKLFDYENPEHVRAVVEQVKKVANKYAGNMYTLTSYTSVGTLDEETNQIVKEWIPGKTTNLTTDKSLTDSLSIGMWPVIETVEVQQALKDLGFDGFTVSETFGDPESGTLVRYKNVGVTEPGQIKSTVGNSGAFAPSDERIQYALSRPLAQAVRAIGSESAKYDKNRDPLLAVPFRSAKGGVNAINKLVKDTPLLGTLAQKSGEVYVNNVRLLDKFLQLSGMAEVHKNILPQIKPYYESIRDMIGKRDAYQAESNAITERWQILNAKDIKSGNKMATVMNRATFYKYDPSKDAGNKNKRLPATQQEREIQQSFDSLPEDFKKLYVDVRNFYSGRYKQFFDLLEKRVRESVKTPERAEKVIDEIKKKYNFYNQIEPYFPLTRFGDYWVRYTENGEMKFEMFENASDQANFKNTIQLRPNVTDVTNGVKLTNLMGELGSGDFVENIMKALEENQGGEADIDGLKDSVWQLYLSNLPELSMRKSFMHRANVQGYSNDALRAFAQNAFHGSYHMARMEFSADASRKLRAIAKAVVDKEEANAPDAVRAGEIYRAINSEQRQKQIWRPDETTGAQRFFGNLGFLYFLSTAASAVTNLTQNFTVGLPIMGTEFGYGRATKELSRAYKQFMESRSLDDFKDLTKSETATEAVLRGERGIRGVFDITRTLEQLRNEAKSPAEKAKYTRELDAMNRMYQTVIHRSQAMDLTGVTDRVSMAGNWSEIGMRFVGMAFHGAEVFNRTTTAIAAYRLSHDKLTSSAPQLSPEERHERALRMAMDIVDRSHFNYSEANKPEFMSSIGPWGKVVFMFKNYAVAYATMLYGSFATWSKVAIQRAAGTPLEQKVIEDAKKARNLMLGLLGMTGLFAGVLGLPTPLLAIVMGIFNAAAGDDDDNEDIPAEVRFKQWLAETMGDNLAQTIMYGPATYFSGADFHSRVGLNQMFFRDPNPQEDEVEATKNYLIQLVGPMGGLAMNIMGGVKMMNEGQTERGIELMLPNVLKKPLQAARFQQEGVLSLSGDPIMDDISTYEKFLTMIGFAPSGLAARYKENAEIRGGIVNMNRARKRILARFALAMNSDDFASVDDVYDDIIKFNDKYPEMAITTDTLERSIQGRAQAQAESEYGVRINKRARALADEMRYLD